MKKTKKKVKEINDLMQSKQITVMDDYFEDVYIDKQYNEVFRVKNQRFFESQEDANSVLEETLSKLKSIETIKEKIWDERLINAFGDLINNQGWLTSDWAEYLENNFKDWDENGNDTNEKKELYGLMYNLDFEESEDGKFIRPIT